MAQKFVVVGASAASMAFVTKLRSLNPDCEIICISGESQMPYNRCFLADHLSGDTTWPEMLLKPDEFFKNQQIILRLGTWVTKIDTQNNCVWIDQESIHYDYLFLGIGTKPSVPPIPIDPMIQSRVFTFHTAQDIADISHFIDQTKPAQMVVVGAGLNGLECAASLHVRGVAVTLIERNNQILPAQVDVQVADYVSKMMHNKGVNQLLGVTLQRVANDQNRGVLATLDTGVTLQADGIVFATGSVVHGGLLEGTGIATQQGSVLVDQSMRTSVANIYAGGDICMVMDNVSKKLVRSATWADAMLQGLCAATQFGEQPRVYPGAIGLRDSSWFGYDFYACGQTVGLDDGCQVYTQSDSGFLKKLYLKDGILQGFVLLGDISQVAQYKQWYMTKVVIPVSCLEGMTREKC